MWGFLQFLRLKTVAHSEAEDIVNYRKEPLLLAPLLRNLKCNTAILIVEFLEVEDYDTYPVHCYVVRTTYEQNWELVNPGSTRKNLFENETLEILKNAMRLHWMIFEMTGNDNGKNGVFEKASELHASLVKERQRKKEMEKVLTQQQIAERQ
jgi:hypothetical protein